MNWNPNKSKGTNVPPPARLPKAPPRAINCPCCGAPLRPNQPQCEYCGVWFDQSKRVDLYADNAPYYTVYLTDEGVSELVERINRYIGDL